jgi:phosphatidylinositol glycan class T
MSCYFWRRHMKTSMLPKSAHPTWCCPSNFHCLALQDPLCLRNLPSPGCHCCCCAQELCASFAPSLPQALVSQGWRALSHTLGSLFCASLNSLARPETTSQPLLTSTPEGPGQSNRTRLYGTLPQEAVCTENLTPWLKLLPCRDVAGLAALFQRNVLFLAGGV